MCDPATSSTPELGGAARSMLVEFETEPAASSLMILLLDRISESPELEGGSEGRR